MTSLDARGFSITLLKADDEIIRLLDVPSKAVGWKPGLDITIEKGDLKLQEDNDEVQQIKHDVKRGPTSMKQHCSCSKYNY